MKRLERVLKGTSISIKVGIIALLLSIIAIGLHLHEIEVLTCWWETGISCCDAHPFFSGVMISWLAAISSIFIVLLFAYRNRDKKEQYNEIFRQSERWLRGITMFVLFYLAIHLASKAFWKKGIPILGESYVANCISPQDVILSFFVFFIIISLFGIAPYVIDKRKNIVRKNIVHILIIISLVLSILIALWIPSFVPVIESSTEPSMSGAYLFRLNAELEDDLNKSVISVGLRNSFKTARFPLSENANVTKEKENEWVITDKKKFIVRKKDDVYLFCWDNVPGKDNESLLRFLRHDLDMGWVENVEINKSDDKTIHIFKDENSAEIMIDEEKEKATLKIGNYDLKVKKENGKLNIYKAGKLNVYRDSSIFWFCISLVVSLLFFVWRFIFNVLEIPKGIKSDFRDLLLIFCILPAIIVASLVLAGDELVKFQFPNVFGNIVVGLVLISGFATLMSMVTISFKQKTVPFPLWNPVWLVSTFASLALISFFSMVFLYLRSLLQMDIFGKVLLFSVAIMIVILLYGFLYEKLLRYHFTEWWRRESKPIAMIVSILLIAIVTAIDPQKIPIKLFFIFMVLFIGVSLPLIIMLVRSLYNKLTIKPIREFCIDLGKILNQVIKNPMQQGMVLVKAKTDPGSLKEVIKGLDGMEGVYQTMVVRGEYDMCLIVEGVDSYDIEKKILEIRKINGVANTTTLRDVREFFDREVK